MKSTALRLESKFFGYPEGLQRRLWRQALDQFPAHTDPDLLAVFTALKRWLAAGVAAPTALESPGGWHKIFNLDQPHAAFIAEGEGGERYIRWLTRLSRLGRPPRGVNLDQWKPAAAAAETRVG